MLYSKKSKCCGCGACMQRCPKKCIILKEDEEGFSYPVVETEKCINCGLCKRVCPIGKEKPFYLQKTLSYAACAKDVRIRGSSSSGGIFSLIAEEILNSNGVVFGAAFDENWMVHHIPIDRKEDLWKLRGSKYLQSRIENSYDMTEKLLKSGRRVLFSGTACQISGLKSFLGEDYDNLYTVDVLCHGVPSPKVWNKYIQSLCGQRNSPIEKIEFRNKKSGWKNFSVCVSFQNSLPYVQVFTDNSFMKMFLGNICLRPSCHDCEFKDLDRQSDLSLGDFWGIENVLPEMDDDYGTSLVLLHSEKGKNLFRDITQHIKATQVDVEIALPKSADSRHSVDMHKRRKVFFQNIDKKKVEELEKYLAPPFCKKVKRKMKSLLYRRKKG